MEFGAFYAAFFLTVILNHLPIEGFVLFIDWGGYFSDRDFLLDLFIQ